MKQLIYLSLMLLLGATSLFAQDNYYQQQAERYQYTIPNSQRGILCPMPDSISSATIQLLDIPLICL